MELLLKLNLGWNYLDEDIFMIRLDKVITMTESKDKKLINLYNHYINEGYVKFLQKESGINKTKS